MTGPVSKLISGTTSLASFVTKAVTGKISSQNTIEDTETTTQATTKPESPPPTSTITPGKRTRPDDEVELQGSRKKHKDMRQGRDDQYPKNVQLIHPPSSEPSERERPVNGTMAHSTGKRKPGGGIHKTFNTLQGNPYAAGQGTSTTQRRTLELSKASMSTSPYVGGSLPEKSRRSHGFDDSGEGFVDSNRPMKKVRMNDVAKTKNPSVDLTDDDDSMPTQSLRSRGSNSGLRDRRNGINSSTANSMPWFRDNETQNLYAMTEMRQPKKPRKRKNKTQSQGTGSAGSPDYDSNDGVSITSTKRIASPVVLIESRSNASTRQPITLGEGVDNVVPKKKLTRTNAFTPSQNKSASERENDIMDRLQAKKAKAQQMAISVDDPSIYDIPPNADEENAANSSRPSNGRTERKQLPRSSKAHSSEERLHSKFTRDDGRKQVTSTRSKATQRMQEHSRPASKVKPIGESSDDELNGPTTVRSPKQNRSNQGQRVRSPSPSDLPPTKFKGSGAASQYDESLDRTPEPDVLVINAFYSKACCIPLDEYVNLTYTNEPKPQINVYNQDDEVQLIPDTGRRVSLTGAEVHKITWSLDNNNVYVQGSMTDTSSGHVCITFKSGHGRDWFIRRIQTIAGRAIEQKTVDFDTLRRTFIHQVREITKAFNREKDRVALQRKRLQITTKSNESDDEIRYEPNSPSTRTGRRDNFHAPRRTSARQSGFSVKLPTPPPPPKWTEIHKPKPWKDAITYPTTGPRRVTVDFEDLSRLDEGEFLNDNLVSFALKRIEENMAAKHKDSVYFFNSFFYTSLMKKNDKVGFNYANVQRWTKNKDIFNIPFIVVPINLHLHWFVAIICNLPILDRRLKTGSDIEDGLQDGDDNEVGALESDANNEGMERLSISQENDQGKRDVFSFDDDSVVEGPGSDAKAFKAGSKGKRKSGPPLRGYDTDAPVIITLDSFGNSRGPEVRNLKQYVIAEAGSKRNMEIDLKDLQGVTAKGIPEQNNYCDCGVYLVGYIEQFAKDPRRFVNKILTRDLGLAKDFDGFDPDEKRAEIRDDLRRLNGDADAQRATEKQAKTAAKRGDQPTSVSPARAKEDDTANAEAGGSKVKTTNIPSSKPAASSGSSKTGQKDPDAGSRNTVALADRTAHHNDSSTTDLKHTQDESQPTTDEDDEMLDKGILHPVKSRYFEPTILDRISSGEPLNASSETIRAENEQRRRLSGESDEIPESQEI